MYQRDQFYGVLFSCPAGKMLTDCPLCKVYHLTFKEKIQWFDGLNYEKQESIINHHIECSKKRK